MLSSTECRLYTCLNRSVPVRQRTDSWVPVQIFEVQIFFLARSTLLSSVLRECLKRSKRVIAWIIATRVGIISAVTVATVSGLAL